MGHGVSSAAPQLSDVRTAVKAHTSGAVLATIYSVHLVLLVDRRHGKQENVSWGIQQKKYITKESPIRSACYRCVSVLRQKKKHIVLHFTLMVSWKGLNFTS